MNNANIIKKIRYITIFLFFIFLVSTLCIYFDLTVYLPFEDPCKGIIACPIDMRPLNLVLVIHTMSLVGLIVALLGQVSLHLFGLFKK